MNRRRFIVIGGVIGMGAAAGCLGGEDDPAEAGLEIVDDNLSGEMANVSIDGVVVNDTGETVSEVMVTGTFYDDEGTRLDQTTDGTRNLEDDDEWSFTLRPTSTDARATEDYDVEIEEAEFE